MTFYNYVTDEDQTISEFTHIDYQVGYLETLFPELTINIGSDCDFLMSNLFIFSI